MKAQLIALLILVSQFCFAQTDTTWYDRQWKKTTKENASFFRPAPKPSGDGFYIKDYYISGVLQSEGWSYTAAGDEWDGVVKYYNTNGKPQSSVTFKDKKQNGEWLAYYPSGVLQGRAILKDKLLEGPLYRYTQDGKLEFYANYHLGKLNGEFKKYDREGHIEEMYAYVNDSLEGDAYRFFPDSSINIKSHFTNNKRSGEWINYFRNHNIDNRSFYKDGLPDGVHSDYDIAGHLMSTDTYVKGVLNGPHKKLFPDGKIREEGNYTNGDGTGKWRFYDRKGALIKEFPSNYEAKLNAYRKDVLHMPVFDKNAAEGDYKLKYANGQVRYAGTVKDHKQEGFWKYYDEKGTLRLEEHFENGLAEQRQSYYDETGKILKTVYYKAGKLDGDITEYVSKQFETVNFYFIDGKEIASDAEFLKKRKQGEQGNESAWAEEKVMEIAEEPVVEAKKVEEASPRYEPIRTYDDKIRMDTVSNIDGVLKLSKTLPRKPEDKRCPEIKELLLNLHITLNGSYVLEQHKEYKPTDNEVILFYEDNTGDIVSGQQMEFRVGKNIKAALKSKQLEISELVGLYQSQIYKGPRINRYMAIRKLENEMK